MALECLAIADEKAVAMSKEKNTMTQQYEVLEKETKRLCEELFTKSSLIERLKAKYGECFTHVKFFQRLPFIVKQKYQNNLIR